MIISTMVEDPALLLKASDDYAICILEIGIFQLSIVYIESTIVI